MNTLHLSACQERDPTLVNVAFVKCLFHIAVAAGLDYLHMSQVVTFLQSERWCVQVLLINDEDVEGDEVFTVQLTNREGTAVTLSPRTASIRIIDEDGEVTKTHLGLMTTISFSVQLSVRQA